MTTSDRLIQRLTHQKRHIAEVIRTLLHNAYETEAELIRVADFPPLHRTEDDILSAPSTFFGCMDGDKIIGVVELEAPDIPAQPASTIASLGVQPDVSRQGIGESLVRFVLAHTPGPLVVATAAANRPAVALYSKLGFLTVGYSNTPENIRLMHLTSPAKLSGGASHSRPTAQ